jgi:hypothetical protein
VKIQWAKHDSTSHNASWLDLAPEQMNWDYKTNLAFDYVASRDIEEGEELFLDYGVDWETAWQEYVENWTPSDHWKDYVSATQYNVLHGTDLLRTDEEQNADPYPENIEIRCHSYLLTKGYLRRPDVQNNPKLHWRNDDKGYPCKIHSRNELHNTYTVLVFKQKQAVQRLNVARQSLSFVDIPYSTDMHLLRAFRHHLVIPNDIFPDAWKNVETLERRVSHGDHEAVLVR